MVSATYLRGVVELAACESIEELLDHAVRLVERECGQRVRIELWDAEGAFSRGEVVATNGVRRTWIGVRYTVGAIHIADTSIPRENLEVLALQLAPLAERQLALAKAARTIDEEIALVYERRIREALVRCDWNVSAVARELELGRARVARVARRWRRT